MPALANEAYENGNVAVLRRNRSTGALVLYLGDLNGETWFRVEPSGLRLIYRD